MQTADAPQPQPQPSRSPNPSRFAAETAAALCPLRAAIGTAVRTAPRPPAGACGRRGSAPALRALRSRPAAGSLPHNDGPGARCWAGSTGDQLSAALCAGGSGARAATLAPQRPYPTVGGGGGLRRDKPGIKLRPRLGGSRVRALRGMGVLGGRAAAAAEERGGICRRGVPRRCLRCPRSPPPHLARCWRWPVAGAPLSPALRRPPAGKTCCPGSGGRGWARWR